jgi:outer membrane biosynthesis protein TonB
VVSSNVFAEGLDIVEKFVGTRGDIPVRKAKLLSSVAMALLLSAGVASAQGMSKDTPERAPAAQQNAPAEKVAPAVKSEQKAPQTTGQATPDKSDKALQKSGQTAPDAKSGKAKETTGQAPKSDADEKAQAPSRSMDNDKKSGAADGKSDASKSTQSTTDQKSKSTQSTTQENRTTTGQGAAAGSANLSTEQRTKITTIIRQHKVEPTHLNVSVSVGTRVPTNVHFYPLPVEVITIYPQWRGYEYILVGEQIVIIDPRTHEIVAIVEA